MRARSLILVLAVAGSALAGDEPGARDAFGDVAGGLRASPPDDAPADPARCDADPLAASGDDAFAPGEAMGFDLRVLGMHAGSVDVEVGRPIRVRGTPAYSIDARARTEGVVGVLDRIDVRAVSDVDERTLTPLRMADHLVSAPVFGSESESREVGAFAGGAVAGRVRDRSRGDDETAALASGCDVVDALSAVYWLRSRALDVGQDFAFDVYSRLHLWHVRGRVAGVDDVSAPAAARRALRLEVTVTRPDDATKKPRHITAWLSDDAERLPLRLSTEENLAALDVELTRFVPGRR